MNKSIYTFVFLSIFFLHGSAWAAPAMTQHAINASSKECSEWFAGDEFYVCELPPGWQIVDHAICPSGYSQLSERIQGTCTETDWSRKIKDSSPGNPPQDPPADLPMQESHVGFEDFKYITQIVPGSYTVPKVAEFMIDNSDMDAPYAIVSEEGDVQHMDIRSLPSDEYNNKGTIQGHDTTKVMNPAHMLDDDITTHTSFHFNDYLRKETKGESVTFDIAFEKPIRTDTLKIDLRSHVTPLFNIAVAAVEDDGALTPLLSRQIHFTKRVTFPETTSDHFRITIDYFDVFQANAVQFVDKNDKATYQKTARFVAQPGRAYYLYSNAEGNYDIPLPKGERPHLWEEDEPLIADLVSVQENSLFQHDDTDNDSIPDKDDNCILVENIKQEDLDGNGIGDMCEDFDYDGVLNAQDNCPKEANHDQKDTDSDGSGDACDTEESRFLARHTWLPQATLALVSVVILILIARILRLKQ